MTALSGFYILTAFLCLIRIFACAGVAVEAEEKGNALAAAAIKKKAHFWVTGFLAMMLFSLWSILSA